jgi:DNA-binding NarL/FixJ family response regulator
MILGLSLKKRDMSCHVTVETHRYRLMNRLNIHHITGLVRYAIRNGLVQPE